MPRQTRLHSVSLLSLLMTGSVPLLSACHDDVLAPAELEEEPEPELAPEELDERQRLARSGLYLLSPGGTDPTPATAEDLTSALDLAASFITGSSVDGADVASAVFDQWGVIEPRRGDSFAVLSTGSIGAVPEPGTDLGSGGTTGDAVTLQLDLQVPEGFSRLSFDYNFVSAESPDYVGSIYNDTFTATLTGPDGVPQEIALASVNSSFFFDASDERAGGTTFDLFSLDPSGVDAVFDGGLPDAGITDFQHVDVELGAPGAYTLTFDVRDLGDGILDSAVILDDLRVYAMERVSLNPLPPPPPEEFNEPELVLLDGTIVDDPGMLNLAEQRVRGVAADGVTQILLRTQVPGPGSVEYSLVSGETMDDGTVGAVNGPSGVAVTVDAVEDAPGQWWAYATYTSPANFDRGTDGALTHREVEVAAAYTPIDPAAPAFEDAQTITLVRPPVVLVHGLWGSALSWVMPLLDDPRLSVHQAEYDSTVDLATHATTVPGAAILEARYGQQAEGIAGSQVDVVAHGIGGLLARQYIAQRPVDGETFGQSAVHKLITLNTPHLGASFADALMEMWNGLDPMIQPGIGSVLTNQGLVINGGAVEDVRVNSTFLQMLGATEVPCHAIVGDGARYIPRGEPNEMGQIVNSPALASVGQKSSLYTFVEQFHPAMPAGPMTPIEDRLAFVFGNTSQVFAEDHDAFAEITSQQGGLDPDATTTYNAYFNDLGDFDYDSVHYNTPHGDPQAARILQLLDEHPGGLSFGTFPAPADLLPLAPQEEPEVPAPIAAVVTPYGLTITSPTAGTEVVPGTTLGVSIEPDPGIDVALLGVVAQSSIVLVDQPTLPGTVELPIAPEAGGELELLAFGISTTGEFLITGPLDLGATPDAAIVDVHIVDRNPILFGVGDTDSVSVTGTYDDGVTRDIGSAATGTEYLSSDPSVFTVSESGEIEATGLGRATLVVRNGGVQDSVTVDVRPAMSAGFELLAEWYGGYCASLLVTNNTVESTSDWQVTLDLGGSTMTAKWEGTFSGYEGEITVGPKHDWQSTILGGHTKDYVGFCVSTPGHETVLPTIVDVTATY